MRNLKNVDRNEVYRYMGFGGELPDFDFREVIETIIDEVATAAEPKFCSADSNIKTENLQVVFETFSVNSTSLSKHLAGCESAVMFAATLGIGVDRLIYKYSMLSPAKAVAAQAAATAMIEMYTDDICEVFAENALVDGLYITKRFSPGYGDFSLEFQKKFISVLNAEKNIGLCMTDADMLVPVKSLTAVVGKTKTKQLKCDNKCASCSNDNCSYKR